MCGVDYVFYCSRPAADVVVAESINEMDSERDIRWVRRKCSSILTWSISESSLQEEEAEGFWWRSFNDGSTLTTSEMAELKLRMISLLLLVDPSTVDGGFWINRFPTTESGVFWIWLKGFFADSFDSLMTVVP